MNNTSCLKPLTLFSVFFAALLGTVGFGWSMYLSHQEQKQRKLPLDLDGWGHRVEELKISPEFTTLLQDPSPWKGPIVPFAMGLAYYIYPNERAVLVANCVWFGLAGSLCYCLGCLSNLPKWCSALAVLVWYFYPPYFIVHGYYFAEPFISFWLMLCLMFQYLQITRNSFIFLDLGTGLTLGVLMLARPPFILAIAGSLILSSMITPTHRFRKACMNVLGIMIVMIPWVVHNYQEFGAIIPFTLEGGKILYQGTYIAGDDVLMSELRKMPEYRELELHVESTMTPLQQYRFWQKAAMENVLSQPLKQLVLIARKTIRFWAYLPKNSWMPSFSTGVFGAISVFFSIIGISVIKKNSVVWLILFYLCLLWCFHLIVHSELRYSFTVFPLLMIFTLHGAAHLLSLNCVKCLSKQS